MDATTVQFLRDLDLINISQWVIIFLAFLVSFLTLYNAVKLKSGILAISTYSCGLGMLCLSASFLLGSLPLWISSSLSNLAHQVLLFLGFALLGYGSYRIFKMSRI